MWHLCAHVCVTIFFFTCPFQVSLILPKSAPAKLHACIWVCTRLCVCICMCVRAAVHPTVSRKLQHSSHSGESRGRSQWPTFPDISKLSELPPGATSRLPLPPGPLLVVSSWVLSHLPDTPGAQPSSLSSPTCTPPFALGRSLALT
jgi:hypothetical protein